MAKKERKGIWIPQSILELDLNGNDKILLAEIYSLCERENGCYASNNHFMKLLGYKTTGAASKRITYLSKKGFITTKNVYQGKLCIGRNIYRNNMMNTLLGIVPRDTIGSDSRNQEVVPNEPEGISVENTINSSINSSLINSYTSTNTGLNSIEKEKSPLKFQSSQISMQQKFEAQYDEAALALIKATTLGENILYFADKNRFPELIDMIGKDTFKKLEPNLLRIIQAQKMLGF